MFNLRTKLVSLGGSHDYYKMSHLVMKSLPKSDHFERLPNMVTIGMDEANTPDKLRDTVLTMGDAKYADAISESTAISAHLVAQSTIASSALICLLALASVGTCLSASDESI